MGAALIYMADKNGAYEYIEGLNDFGDSPNNVYRDNPYGLEPFPTNGPLEEIYNDPSIYNNAPPADGNFRRPENQNPPPSQAQPSPSTDEGLGGLY